jgi:alpha-mannosidase
MEIIEVVARPLFIGSEEQPRQVVQVRLAGTETGAGQSQARVSIRGARLSADPKVVGALAPGERVLLEVGVAVDGDVQPGTTLAAEVLVEHGAGTLRQPFDLLVAEPGWRMFMISHFHYDPVWWNTQAAYTETWGAAYMFRSPYQEPGLALVKAHLEMARRDPDYKFVLAELDYLKPYWDTYPEDRAFLRQLMRDGRLELMGGTYNEPNTNLTSAETTVRNAIYGVAYQRDVLGGSPQTAWQLDAFGHDPQFPGIMADAGLNSSSWARGPFHEWGPNWWRGSAVLPPVWTGQSEPTGMQFPSEFEWISPGGGSVLTCFMANHYSAGWWMDAAPTLEDAERQVFALFRDLSSVAATRNVLLPVGTDYTPPNKWLTAIHRDWARRYVWPKFLSAIPREFFDAVRAEQQARGRQFSPQTRDMNPIYTGKDVSFIDTKQAQRQAENTLLGAEKFATMASLLGARYPSEAIDKAWRQLLFGAHHDGITGSESDQVYLDLLAGWREASELSGTVLDGAIRHLGRRIDTSGAGSAVVVFNPLSWPRTDLARADLVFEGSGVRGLELKDDQGQTVPFVVEAVERQADGSLARIVVSFVARDVPSVGYRTYRAIAAPGPSDSGWTELPGTVIENATYRIEVDPDRGGAITSLIDKRSGKELVRADAVGNELLACSEYPNHPLFGEGPWHLTPTGRYRSSADGPAHVRAERSAIGTRLRVVRLFEGCQMQQDIVLYEGIDRVGFATRLDGYDGNDVLFRIRFGADVDGAASVSEVGDATVGRGFGFPTVDVSRLPFTLDNPAYNWFALSTTARIELTGEGAPAGHPRAARALSIAEVIGVDEPGYDSAARELMVALVRQGVTATLGHGDGHRYGTLTVDSNLPDVRFALGGPAENAFTERLLAAVDAKYRAELDRQLAGAGRARVWVPAAEALADIRRMDADLRAVGELPVLIVAGADQAQTVAAVRDLALDLADSVVTVEQPPALDGNTGTVEAYTVGVLNVGLPGFNVEADGSLYLSLMRSCSGWPSGVWIDPPRRTAPDGSNFQFQHWSHRFDYALASGAGDWRDVELVRAGHEHNNPMIARSFEAHPGDLPQTASFVQVEPASVVLTALKPAGEPLAHHSSSEQDPERGVVLRLYEATGRRTRATITSLFPLSDVAGTNVVEEEQRPIAQAAVAGVAFDLDAFEIATLRATPGAFAGGRSGGAGEVAELGPRHEVAQPVYADYWLHNKGPAPMGYKPVAVSIRPGRATGPGPFTIPISVASSLVDAPASGTVTVVPPPGWVASPAERPFSLAPGAHLEFEATVAASVDAAAGRYFVAARIEDATGQAHEDVVTIDLVPGKGPVAVASNLSEQLEQALGRTSRRAHEILGEAAIETAGDMAASEPSPVDSGQELGNELQIALITPEVKVTAGQRGELRVTIRNLVASEIRAEAQLISPHETWPISSPWTQGVRVGPGEEQTLSFGFQPPSDFAPGNYWALIKVMYFGRLYYTESARVEVLSGA